MTVKKKKVEISHDCCGECAYFRKIGNAHDAIFKCYVNPPEFSHVGEDEEGEVFACYVRDGFPTPANAPKCCKFFPSIVN